VGVKLSNILNLQQLIEDRNRWFDSEDGQDCLAPDNALFPRAIRERLKAAFVAGARAAVRQLRPKTTGMVEGLRLMRLKQMVAHPNLYSLDATDIETITWAIRLIESIEAEREAMRQEQAGIQEGIRKLVELDGTWDQKSEV
jgi:hypothetical protein